MRADRLLSILLLLQVHHRLTARSLAERLEVSQRTIHRDMDALSGAGIPVYAERGAGGGWILPEEFRTKPVGLNEAEIRALLLATPARLLADLGLDRASNAGLVKLLAALPTAHRRDADDLRQRIHLDVSGWQRSDEPVPLLPTLQDAVWRDRKLRLSYRRSDGASVDRLVDPLGLVANGRVWYLVAAVDDQLRTYRVSRVLDAQPTAEPFIRPGGFDLAAHWAASKADFVSALPRFAVTVRADAAIIPRLRQAGWYARIEHISPPDASGWCNVQIRCQFEEDACEYILAFGPRIEVVEPSHLREKIVELAAGILARYATDR